MTQITLRGLDPAVEKKVRAISQKTGKSLNRVIQEIIYKHLGFNSKKDHKPSQELRKLAGGWTEDEATAFFKSIESCETIDEEMWK